MIEIICENESKAGDAQTAAPQCRIPKNIRQIGEPQPGRRIYIEDYVYTYLVSLAKDKPGYAAYGVRFYGILLGETHKSAGETSIFVRSAVRVITEREKQLDEGTFDDKEYGDGPDSDDDVRFSPEIWKNLYDSAEKYFKGQEIIGWFLCDEQSRVVTDCENPALIPSLQKIHFDNFSGAAKVMFLVDTHEQEEYFYMVDKGRLERQSGFICFYEKNESMQEYMLASRPARSVDENVDDSVITNFRSIIREKKADAVKHQNMSLMYGIFAFMIVVVTVIGINMMNSYEKMQTLDASMSRIAKEIANMNVEGTDYDNLTGTPVTKIDGNVYPTTAAANAPVTESIAETKAAVSGTAGRQPSQNESQTSDRQASVLPTDVSSQASAVRPSAADTTVSASVSQPARTYIVVQGDTLMSICKTAYGDTQKYKDIMEINRMDNPDKIFIGQELLLP